MIEQIERELKERGWSWREYEVEHYGKVHNSLKRKITFNIKKLNAILEPLGLEVSVTKCTTNGTKETESIEP